MYTEEYVHNDILSTDPVELICLLYSKAIEWTQQARLRFEEGDPARGGQASARAMEVVLELISSLDAEQGGEIAANLGSLYVYVQEQLAEATTEHETKCLDNAERVLTTLLEGWKECRQKLLVEGGISGAQTSDGSDTHRAWTS